MLCQASTTLFIRIRLHNVHKSVLPAGSHEKSVEKSVEISRFFGKISRKSVEN